MSWVQIPLPAPGGNPHPFLLFQKTVYYNLYNKVDLYTNITIFYSEDGVCFLAVILFAFFSYVFYGKKSKRHRMNKQQTFGIKGKLTSPAFDKALLVVHLNKQALEAFGVCGDSIKITIIPGQGVTWINPDNAASISEVFVNYPFPSGSLKANAVFLNHFDRPNKRAFRFTLNHLPKGACQIKEVSDTSLSVIGAGIEIPVHSGTVATDSSDGLFEITPDFRR